MLTRSAQLKSKFLSFDYEGDFRSGNYYRFERYRCQSCKRPLEVRIDKPIKDEFPEIKEVSIEILNDQTRNSRTFNKDSSDILFCCSNHKCTNPGILIGLTIRDMLMKQQTHREYYEFCAGFEPSPKWRKKTPCTQSFKVTIDIVLKNNEAGGGQV